MAQETIEKQIGDSVGRPKSKPSKAHDIFTPSKMDPTLYAMTFIRNCMPDPDEVFAKGGLTYSDLFNLERDAHVSSCVQQRKSATLAHRIRVEPGPGATGVHSEKAVLLCKRMLDLWGQNRRDTISHILTALFVGMQPFELNWFFDNEVGGLIVERPQDTLQEWFVYSPDGELRFKPSSTSFVTKPVPPFKVLMARHFPSMRNPYGKKLFSACYWPSTFKRGGLKFFAEYAERFGMPTVNIEGTSATSAVELHQFASEVIAMARQGVIATRGNFKVTLDDMKTKYQTTNLYDAFMNTMDMESSKGLLGQTLTTEAGGSRAQADIHKQILEVLWKSDDEFVGSVLTDLFDMVTYVNFGRDVIGPVARVGEAMGTDRIERDNKLRDFHGVDFTDEYICKNYDLQPGDFVRVDPLKASYAPEPDTAVAPSNGGARKSEAAKTVSEARQNHRNRGSK